MELVLCVHDDWSDCIGVRAILVAVGSGFLFLGRALKIVLARLNLRELECALLDLDYWMVCGSIYKYTYSYVFLLVSYALLTWGLF